MMETGVIKHLGNTLQQMSKVYAYLFILNPPNKNLFMLIGLLKDLMKMARINILEDINIFVICTRGDRGWSNQSSTFKGQGYNEPPHEVKEEIDYIWSEPKIKDPGSDYKPGKFPKLDEAIRNLKNGKR